jgi:TonB-linked SusC/RagA family outer membrane protein
MEKMFRLMRGCKKNAHLRKIWMTMKLTIFLFFLAVSQMMAVETYSQSTRLSLNLQSVAVKDVLDQIEQKSEFVFLYNSKLIDVDRTVSLNLKDQKISDVLDKLFQEADVVYTIVDRQIVLTNKADQAGFLELSNVQQQKSISGKVTDATGSPLPGVTVVVKGTSQGIITDSFGNYSLTNVPENATVQFSFVGMKTQEIAVGKNATINVTLVDETIGLDEVVAIGYGTQKKGTITGSVSAVKGDVLTVSPMASTANTLAGHLPGLVSLQKSGQPGFDEANLSIRGFGDALVIVDGVQSSFNNIDANEIESVSILKDGAASIYGSRAGNGVILVTTKRGHDSKPTITLNSSFTMQGITVMPLPASSGQYAEMKSEAWLQSGQPAATVPFTEEQIQKYYDAADPYLYPNTNWYNELTRDWAPQQQHNLSVRGGSDRIKYYGFIGFLDQETIWKKNGGNYGRNNLQSNIDAKILDNLSLQLDVSSITEDREFPWRPQGEGANTVWQDYWNTLPIYPATLPDATKIPYAGPSGVGGAHVITNSEIAGYHNTELQTLKGTGALNYTFNFIKGLTAKALYNVIQTSSNNKHFTRPANFYTYDPASQIYTLAGATGDKASLSQTDDRSKIKTGQISLNYQHTFAENHQVKAFALYEAIDYSSDYLTAMRINFLTPAIEELFAGSTTNMTNNGSASEMGRKSYVGRLNYSYKEKYLVETILRADASAKFPSDKRWGYFPSVSLGWKISDENFMKGLQNLDHLKLRASYGQSGNDGVGNFQYLTGYKYGLTHILNNATQQGIVSTGLPNPNLTWEEISIYNAGIDFSMWKRKLYGEADIFYRERSGIPSTRIATLPSTFGANLPPENLNSLNDRGFDVKLGTAGSINDLTYDLNANISYTRSKWDHFEEPVYTDPDQERLYKKSGQWTDRAFGYASDGLFTSQDQINSLTFNQDGQGNKSLRPGDIRYKDTNLDGTLDWKDQVEIGKGTIPHWMVGFNTNLKYKDFDFSALFQGAFDYYNYIVLTHGALAPALVYDLRWTEENNNPNAFIPRLGGAATNNYGSDHYYQKAGYIRLKTLSFGYNLPKHLLEPVKLSGVRFYFAGYNLLTFDKLSKYGTDPEAPSGNAGYYYPQQKTITFGVNITL